MRGSGMSSDMQHPSRCGEVADGTVARPQTGLVEDSGRGGKELLVHRRRKLEPTASMSRGVERTRKKVGLSTELDWR